MVAFSLLVILLFLDCEVSGACLVTFHVHGEPIAQLISLCGHCLDTPDLATCEYVAVTVNKTACPVTKNISCVFGWWWATIDLKGRISRDLPQDEFRLLDTRGVTANFSVYSKFSQFVFEAVIPDHRLVVLNLTSYPGKGFIAVCGECLSVKKHMYGVWGDNCAKWNRVPVKSGSVQIQLVLPSVCSTYVWEWVSIEPPGKIDERIYEVDLSLCDEPNLALYVIYWGFERLVPSLHCLNATFNNDKPLDGCTDIKQRVLTDKIVQVNSPYLLDDNSDMTVRTTGWPSTEILSESSQSSVKARRARELHTPSVLISEVNTPHLAEENGVITFGTVGSPTAKIPSHPSPSPLQETAQVISKAQTQSMSLNAHSPTPTATEMVLFNFPSLPTTQRADRHTQKTYYFREALITFSAVATTVLIASGVARHYAKKCTPANDNSVYVEITTVTTVVTYRRFLDKNRHSVEPTRPKLLGRQT